MFFLIHTQETVHGVYGAEAESVEDARAMFERGEITKPIVYESLDSDITSITLTSPDPSMEPMDPVRPRLRGA